MVDRETLEQQANRLDLVSRWADDLAHEIKNPLHAMVINLELVKRRAETNEPGLLIERAEVVESELHRVHGLVDSLLRLVRPWPTSTAATVQQVFDALLPVFHARARIRRVEYEHRPGVAIVAMPPGDLAQVLVNLVDNAIDASPEGGQVVTEVSKEGAHATLVVRDRGPGLPPSAIDAIQGPSTASEAGGAGADPAADGGERPGLGLAVTRRLVERAGGSLLVAPAEDGGTRVTVTIPCTGSA
jgi:two-component system, NtrC family, sensor histidine kinase HydH